MLDKIKDLFKDGLQYSHTAGVLQQVGNILSIVSSSNMRDKYGTNTALDAICEMLQSHKDNFQVAIPEVPAECSSCP